MSEPGKGGLLLPLGIGAGLLLLFGMKKAKAATAPPMPDANAAIPLVSAADAAVPQIDPQQAPSYEAVSKAGGNDANTGDEEEEATDEADGGQDEGGGDDEQDSGDDEREDGSSAQMPGDSPGKKTGAPPKVIRTAATQNTPVGVQRQQVTQQQRKVQGKRVNQGMMTSRQATVAKQPAAKRVWPGIVNAGQQILTTAAAVVPAQTTIFPLRFGSTSPYVKEVQRRLGVSATGFFGTMTRAAIKKRFGVLEISEALYKQIITGKPPVKMVPKPTVHRPALHPARKIKKPVPKGHKIHKRK